MKLWLHHARISLERMLDWRGLMMLQALFIGVVACTPLLLLPSLTGGWGDHVLYAVLVVFLAVLCGATGASELVALRRLPLERFTAVVVDLGVWGFVVGAVVVGGGVLGMMLTLLVLEVVDAAGAMMGMVTAVLLGFGLRRVEVDTQIPVVLPLAAFMGVALAAGPGLVGAGAALLVLLFALVAPDGLALPSRAREVVAPEITTRTYRGADVAFFLDLARGMAGVWLVHALLVAPILLQTTPRVAASLCALVAFNTALLGASRAHGASLLPLAVSRQVSQMQLVGALLGGMAMLPWCVVGWLGHDSAGVVWTGALASLLSPIGLISVTAARVVERWSPTRRVVMIAGGCLAYGGLVFLRPEDSAVLGGIAAVSACMALVPWIPMERSGAFPLLG